MIRNNSMYLQRTLLGLAIVLGLATTDVYASNLIHSHEVSFAVGTGIDYTQSRRITRAGLVDVHILTVDMTNPFITVGPALPDHGSRHTTTDLLQNSGATAGINADFFNTARNPITPYGQVIQNGVPLQLTRQQGYASTFGVDMNNQPFMAYLQPDLVFINGGAQHVHIRDMNKVNGPIVASIFDRNAIYTTAGLDERQAGLIKVMVDNGYIVYISQPGELVNVPEHGFIVVLAEHYAYEQGHLEHLHVGQSASREVRGTIDLDNIWNAVGGGGQLVRHGEAVSGWAPTPNARHPRSAVGISQDRGRVFMVAVDGRSHSIGVTHAELAEIMIELGAYQAMHFDGGGSTTMGLRHPGTSNISLANLPSDGAQRAVTNAVGVFNTAPLHALTDLALQTFPREHVFVGDVLHVYPIGLDDHLNPLALSANAQLNVWANIARTGNHFYPIVAGPLEFGLVYGELGLHATVDVLELAEIVPNHRTLNLETGEQAHLSFSGLSPRGQRGALNRVEVSVIPEQAGAWHNGVFVAGTVSGVIQARVGGVTTYIGVNVNEQGHVMQPAGNVARNPFRQQLDGHLYGHGFDITVVGNTSLSYFLEHDELSHFVNQRNEMLTSNFTVGSHLGVFLGATEVENVDNFQTMHWSRGYRFNMVTPTTAMVHLNAERDSLTGTSVYNWGFIREVEWSQADHVILLLNRPVASLPAYERQMLNAALEDMATHRSVFVVSSYGTASTNTMINGVTHINLGSLFDEEGLNPGFSVLRFRVSEVGIGFDIH